MPADYVVISYSGGWIKQTTFWQQINHHSTVIVIVHNLSIMKAADEITEMVQGEGKKGGRIISEGTPKKMKKTDT